MNIVLSQAEKLPSQIKDQCLEIFDILTNNLEYYDMQTGAITIKTISRCNFYITIDPLYIHIFGAMLCLSFSVIYHIFYPYSETAQSVLSRLDYGGISLMSAGTAFPPIIYGFACNFAVKASILSIVLIAAIFAFGLTLSPNGDSPAFRNIRGVSFFISGAFAAIPIVIAAISTESESLWYWIIGHTIYIFSAIFYVTRIPERFSPGKYDSFVLYIIHN